MNKIQNYKIVTNEKIAMDTYKLILNGDSSFVKSPGMFINLSIDNFYLKRPISICDKSEDTITLIYKVVGDGTKSLSQKQTNENIKALVGLGNGFNTNISENEILIVGGGVGIPPLYYLAKIMSSKVKTTVILGFNNAQSVFYEKEFASLDINCYICTIDGSLGHKGMVTDLIQKHNLHDRYYFTCGPYPMLKAVSNLCTKEGQISFEERMGCGFGACMGCSHETKEGYKRICKEGPVLLSGEVIWK